MGSPRLGSALKLASVLIPAASGLAASALLLVDYVRPAPVFCGAGGGCEAMRKTIYASFFGVPTPIYGVVVFLFLGVLALLRGRVVRVALASVAALGALGAIFLLGVQFRANAFCVYCAIADVSMIALAIAAAARIGWRWDDAPRAVVPEAAIGGVALAAALLAPIGIGMAKKPPPEPPQPIPDAIIAEVRETPKGLATVIDFVDFECPFCRMNHEGFGPVLESRKEKVRLIRKQVPLSHIHPNAMNAARAACCGEKLGKGDQMAEALFTTNDLSAGGCEKVAATLGLELGRFRACVEDPATQAKIDQDVALFKASRGKGLPTIWIDLQKFEGARSGEELGRAIDAALARAGS